MGRCSVYTHTRACVGSHTETLCSGYLLPGHTYQCLGSPPGTCARVHTQCPARCHTHMHCVQVLCYPDTHTPCLGSYLYKHAMSRISLAQTHIHCVQDLTQTHTCNHCVQDFACLDANAHTPCDWDHALTRVYSVWNLSHTQCPRYHTETHIHTHCLASLTPTPRVMSPRAVLYIHKTVPQFFPLSLEQPLLLALV